MVCLANSYKEGKRCLAGIELNSRNQPKISSDRPKWIRPICKTLHGEVHTYLINHINLLDVFEIDVTGYPEKKDFQSENAFFEEDSINVTGVFDPRELANLCCDEAMIFGNRRNAVSEEEIGALTHSLILIRIQEFRIRETNYEGKTKIRLVFSYQEHEYDLPITDPVFIKKYKANSNFLTKAKTLFVTLSLGIKFHNEYYKLVAGIVLES